MKVGIRVMTGLMLERHSIKARVSVGFELELELKFGLQLRLG